MSPERKFKRFASEVSTDIVDMLVCDISDVFPRLGYILTDHGDTTLVEFFLDEGQEVPVELRERWHIEEVGCETNQWLETFRKSFEGVEEAGVRVVPPWLQQSDYDVVIYPGMAFGTGEHESTRLALGLLARLDLRGKSVLDVGTGSGVLAIYAAKAGASTVEGIDIDPISIENAVENARLNNVSVYFSVGDAYEVTGRYDVVVANLVTDLLIELKDVLWACSTAYLVLSGVTREDFDSVVRTYGFPSLAAIGTEWVGLLYRVRNAQI